MSNLLKFLRAICVAGGLSLFPPVAVASGQGDVLGDWLWTTKIPRFAKRPNVVSPNPALNQDWLKQKVLGYDTLSSTLSIMRNHTFLWKPLNWTGSWSYGNGVLVMRPSGNSPYLNNMNGYSSSSTNGVPDLRLSYSKSDRTLSWVTGSRKYKTKAVMVLRRKLKSR